MEAVVDVATGYSGEVAEVIDGTGDVDVPVCSIGAAAVTVEKLHAHTPNMIGVKSLRWKGDNERFGKRCLMTNADLSKASRGGSPR